MNGFARMRSGASRATPLCSFSGARSAASCSQRLRFGSSASQSSPFTSSSKASGRPGRTGAAPGTSTPAFEMPHINGASRRNSSAVSRYLNATNPRTVMPLAAATVRLSGLLDLLGESSGEDDDGC
ncbi:uncharacterized protein ACA1_351930 [Acanthamoeba castellanii str. Neff]|uniref:Uncharacterized protein n=1 Tax=Acanthamoeba castellanii (strain ATCC 30010 / Neff) TaxID=1257118 RepID=L8GDB3_ACACF|nr:uncharacterized protein ACA1_351930 [Acanthamoeba castellanii str. Neff]ELR11115.1 hypothetical protein ACA1_351930 [Acanthamoeba castellanii str. Neff]